MSWNIAVQFSHGVVIEVRQSHPQLKVALHDHPAEQDSRTGPGGSRGWRIGSAVAAGANSCLDWIKLTEVDILDDLVSTASRQNKTRVAGINRHNQCSLNNANVVRILN